MHALLQFHKTVIVSVGVRMNQGDHRGIVQMDSPSPSAGGRLCKRKGVEAEIHQFHFCAGIFAMDGKRLLLLVVNRADGERTAAGEDDPDARLVEKAEADAQRMTVPGESLDGIFPARRRQR